MRCYICIIIASSITSDLQCSIYCSEIEIKREVILHRVPLKKIVQKILLLAIRASFAECLSRALANSNGGCAYGRCSRLHFLRNFRWVQYWCVNGIEENEGISTNTA